MPPPCLFGFTLIELLVVIIIVSIIAAVAAPNFTRGAERARVRDAEAVLSAIFSAERVYFLDEDTFGSLANLTGGGYLTDPDASDTADDDGDWDYSTENVSQTTFRAVAARMAGANETATITVDETFPGDDYDGTHPLRTDTDGQ